MNGAHRPRVQTWLCTPIVLEPPINILMKANFVCAIVYIMCIIYSQKREARTQFFEMRREKHHKI